LIRSTLIKRSNDSDVYMSARRSMTIRFYAHSKAKRVEAVALIDSGATENFMNLEYAKWLKLPIKQLPEPRKLFNVDGTANKSGDLRFFTDLQTKTGQQTTRLRFFLSDLGEHKVILGYPWFAAVQPKIDWQRGWIDTSQLPLVLKSDDAQKARFVPRTRNTPRKVERQIMVAHAIIYPKKETQHTDQRTKQPTVKNQISVPEQYKEFDRVFNEEASQE